MDYWCNFWLHTAVYKMKEQELKKQIEKYNKEPITFSEEGSVNCNFQRSLLCAELKGIQEGKAEAIKIIKRYSKFHIPKAIGDEMIKELKEQKQELGIK